MLLCYCVIVLLYRYKNKLRIHYIINNNLSNIRLSPMIQYSIEGDIDFFKELETFQTTDIEDDNKCMLSDEVLRPDAVTLECGHKFNYKPLFSEVLMQKCSTLPKNMSSSMTASYVHLSNNNTHNNNNNNNNNNNENTVVTMNYNASMSMETMKLNYNEIKCPYCRTITSKLLPYYPYPEIKQIRYVNYPLNLCMPGVKCCYFASKSIDKECDNAPTYDEKYGVLCKTHMKSAMKPTRVKPPKGTGAGAGAGAGKQGAAKNTDAKYSNGNVIVYSSNVSPVKTGCSYILVAGNRKGSACGCVAYTAAAAAAGGDDHNNTENKVVLCKRHYNKG